MALSPRREAFCNYYIAEGMNGTAAARRAGYKHPEPEAVRLLRNALVRARIDELSAPGLAKLEISQASVLREIGLVAFARFGDLLHVTDDGDPFLDFNKMEEAHKAALEGAEIEDFVDNRERNADGEVVARAVRRVKGKMGGKLKALEMLARHTGLLKDQVEVTVSEDFAATLAAARKRAKEKRT